jgi:hypothetical protein
MKLFDHKERTDSHPAKHLDNSYDYYDRSSSEKVAQVRDLLNRWFDNYPKQGKDELKKRFQISFSSPFFELFIHELFRRQGFILEPHPKVEGTSRRPDFLAKGHGLEFYLEAKEATDKTEADLAIEKRLSQLYDQINTTNCPNFYLRFNELLLKSNNQPSGKKIVRHLENELPKFNPDEILKKYERSGLDELDAISYADDDIRLVFSLIPKPIHVRGKEGQRPIGIYPSDTTWGGSDDSIKTSIEKKATKYGELDKPFVICVNSTSDRGLDYFDMLNALFGSLQVSWSEDPANRDERLTRGRDGIFPKFKRVSGIFITRVHVANLDNANHWLVQHPYAKRELSFDPFTLTKVKVENRQIKILEGKRIKEILEIPDKWLMKEELHIT